MSETERKPVTTCEDLALLDEADVLEGYKDGLAGDPEPGNNRSRSYWHGWRNGHSDHTGKVTVEGLMLARAVVTKSRKDKVQPHDHR